MTNYHATSTVGAIWGLALIVEGVNYPQGTWPHRLFVGGGTGMLAISYQWARVAD